MQKKKKKSFCPLCKSRLSYLFPFWFIQLERMRTDACAKKSFLLSKGTYMSQIRQFHKITDEKSD